MKLIKLILLILIFVGCKKAVPYVEPDWEAIRDKNAIGSVKLNLNNDSTVKFYPNAYFRKTDSSVLDIYLTSFKKEFFKYYLSFKVKITLGVKRINKFENNSSNYINQGYFQLLDHDATCNTFDVNEADSLNNWFALDSYNPVTKEISGRFSLSTYRPANSSAPCGANTPYEYNIRNGVFNTVVQ